MAISPSRLNQPVNHDQTGPPSSFAHQYGPPAVGYADATSAMLKATARTMMQTIGHPQEMATGPPRFHACG